MQLQSAKIGVMKVVMDDWLRRRDAAETQCGLLPAVKVAEESTVGVPVVGLPDVSVERTAAEENVSG